MYWRVRANLILNVLLRSQGGPGAEQDVICEGLQGKARAVQEQNEAPMLKYDSV